jgi:hypothetical protein
MGLDIGDCRRCHHLGLLNRLPDKSRPFFLHVKLNKCACIRSLQNRINDLLVAGSAAEVASQRLLNLFFSRAAVPIQQGFGGKYNAWGAMDRR